jgi:predicted CoA-binding protein
MTTLQKELWKEEVWAKLRAMPTAMDIIDLFISNGMNIRVINDMDEVVCLNYFENSNIITLDTRNRHC